MRRWWLAITLLLSVGVNLGILGAIAVHRLRPRPPEPAAGREAPETGPPAARLARLADRLGLAGEARERFLAQQRRFFLATARERLRLQGIHRQLRSELVAEKPDRQRIEALLAEAAPTYVALERAMAENVLATREMLDPDQERVFLQFVSRLRPLRERLPETPMERRRERWRRRHPLRSAPGQVF